MSYGFSATNNYNQILISSDTRNLHFIAKAYLYDTLLASDYYGGVRQWRYRIGTSQDIVPLPFFTMTGNEYYGVSAVRKPDTSPSIILTTQPINIEGTLNPKSYAWGTAPITLTEGINYIYNVNTTNVPDGTVLYWDINPSDTNDFLDTNGSFTVGSNTASFQITPTKTYDPYPEATETYTINVRNYTNLTGPLLLTKSFTVSNATSTDITGFGWSTDSNWGPSSITENDNSVIDTAPPGAFVVSSSNSNNAIIATSPKVVIRTQVAAASEYFFISTGWGTSTQTGFNTGSNLPAGNTGFPIVFTTALVDTVFYWSITTGNTLLDNLSTDFKRTSGYATVLAANPSKYNGDTRNVIEFTVESQLADQRAVNDGNTTYTGITTYTGATITSTYKTYYFRIQHTNNTGAFVRLNQSTLTTLPFYYQFPSTPYTTAVYWGAPNFYAGVTTWGARRLNEGLTGTTTTSNRYYIKDTGTNTTYWTINHITTSDADFTAVSGTTILASGSGTSYDYFNIRTALDAVFEGDEEFTISIRSGSITGTVLTTSPVITINNLTAQAAPYIVTPSSVIEGTTFTTTFYTDGVVNGTTLYWKINNINTTSNDFSTGKFGSVVINNNTGTASITTVSDGATEQDEAFTISLVDKAAANYLYWTINHISSNDSDFYSTSGVCIPGGYDWWYFDINAVLDSATEGSEKFSISIRQGSTTGTVQATSGAIGIYDNSVNTTNTLRYTLVEGPPIENTTYNITVYTPNISDGTTLYWDINHITTTDADFATTFGTFSSSSSGAIIPITVMGNDASEADEGFTINIRTQPKYIWEVELIRSGTSNTVPEVYIFADPRASTTSPTETQGLVVYKDDGTISFDSRRSPLVISAGTAVTFPSNPRPSLAYGLSHLNCGSQGGRAPSGGGAGDAFVANQENAYNVGILPTKPIYFLPTLAQAEREQKFTRQYDECQIGRDKNGNCLFDSRINYKEESTYWCFYRGGIRRDGNYIYSGWIAVDWFCFYKNYRAEVIIGNDYGSPQSSGGGEPPYSNETINLSAAAVLVSDGALYD